jgi:nitrogen-specific signal transduction histidine kinase
LLDEIGVGLVIIGDGGEILVTNRISDGMLSGRTGGVPLMHKLYDLLDAAERTESGRRSRETTVDLIDESGKKSIVSVRIVSSRRLGTMITLTDVTETERSQAERRQIERLSEVGKACAMVAHEIGNPLAAIKATIQSIEHEADAAGLGDSLHAVNREID